VLCAFSCAASDDDTMMVMFWLPRLYYDATSDGDDAQALPK
jgi:hypothetical protein